jgi:P-type E1-E2 ATPase
VLPADKTDMVRRLQEQGSVVAMVGDGVNGASALAQADLGLSIGTSTDVAMAFSSVFVVLNSLRLQRFRALHSEAMPASRAFDLRAPQEAVPA